MNKTIMDYVKEKRGELTQIVEKSNLYPNDKALDPIVFFPSTGFKSKLSIYARAWFDALDWFERVESDIKKGVLK